jgi:catechol O-methyltransferase
MEHDPETAALIKKYPSLRKPIETGIEVPDSLRFELDSSY